MNKRTILLGDYDTATNGWTLSSWRLAPAEPKTQYIEKPGGDGTWDISTVLTDGIIKYKDRNLTARLECSEGTRTERETKIRQLINSLDGMKVEIRLPDDELHHVVGRLHIAREYNDLAHAAVSVSAICEPWKYANAETIVEVTATADAQQVALQNAGRRAVVPQVRVTEGPVLLEYGPDRVPLSAGTYQWPNLLLTPGGHALTYSGKGDIIITYREAVLE